MSSDPLCERHMAIGAPIVAVLVHHKDRDETNTREDNLESLCVECHEAEHRAERWGRRMAGG